MADQLLTGMSFVPISFFKRQWWGANLFILVYSSGENKLKTCIKNDKDHEGSGLNRKEGAGNGASSGGASRGGNAIAPLIHTGAPPGAIGMRKLRTLP